MQNVIKTKKKRFAARKLRYFVSEVMKSHTLAVHFGTRCLPIRKFRPASVLQPTKSKMKILREPEAAKCHVSKDASINIKNCQLQKTVQVAVPTLLCTLPAHAGFGVPESSAPDIIEIYHWFLGISPGLMYLYYKNIALKSDPELRFMQPQIFTFLSIYSLILIVVATTLWQPSFFG
ncbi:hypothetical protein CYMTET_5480 [Cymbomonas tetramitiformis]|uniref:Uncharacterized protein n=1 Tax=Cymbomonas tetramitiformis TaxID=36881 RepID=A0AAE0GZE2_9CHLO|nr:hypothetical protein CYMTET_5480 [Cymbomonas tetramitiformis]